MNEREQIELVDRLRANPAETEWLEFKRAGLEPQRIGECLSAIANSMAPSGRFEGYLLLGIDDSTHEVVGTMFDPFSARVGNQELMLWLTTGMSPCPRITAQVVRHPKGNVVVFTTGPAHGQPVSFRGIDYVRVGSSTTRLRRHPEIEREIWTRRHDWPAEVCERASMSNLDQGALNKARKNFIKRHPRQEKRVKDWDDVTLLNKAYVLDNGAITNAALLLLGKPESVSLIAPAVAMLSWAQRDADGREIDNDLFRPPFLLASNRLVAKIRSRNIRAMPPDSLFPERIAQYDTWVLREALHNCIAHQDYLRRFRASVLEYPDHILLTNAGTFLPGNVEDVLKLNSPQSITRNPFLAGAMRELDMIDIQGGGIRRMFESQKQRFLPMPDYDLSRSGWVSVTIPGRILDESYTRLLMEKTNLSLQEVVLLDRVQKGNRIERDAAKHLKANFLVEGRYPNLFVAGPITKSTGKAGGAHTLGRGLGRRHYLATVLALIGEQGPIKRKDIDRAIGPMLPSHLSETEKQRRVSSLLQELRKLGKIARSGPRSDPEWHLPPVKRS